MTSELNLSSHLQRLRFRFVRNVKACFRAQSPDLHRHRGCDVAELAGFGENAENTPARARARRRAALRPFVSSIRRRRAEVSTASDRLRFALVQTRPAAGSRPALSGSTSPRAATRRSGRRTATRARRHEERQHLPPHRLGYGDLRQTGERTRPSRQITARLTSGEVLLMTCDIGRIVRQLRLAVVPCNPMPGSIHVQRQTGEAPRPARC